MTSVARYASLAAFVVAALATLAATAALVHASWRSVIADCPPTGAEIDRSYWITFVCVVVGAAVTLRAARHLVEVARARRDDEPVLWI